MGELGQTATPWIFLLMALGGLVMVVGRLLPLFPKGRAFSAPLRHLGTLPLTSQCSVALVQIGRETWVLGLAPSAVTLLAKVERCWEGKRQEGEVRRPQGEVGSPVRLPAD